MVRRERGPVALCLADTHSNHTALCRLDARLTRTRRAVDLILVAVLFEDLGT
jgi:hypothetical protein